MSTVPHSAGQSRILIRCSASREMRQMSRIFFKMLLLFFSLPIILHFCLETQQSDELPITLGSYFAHRQTASIFHARQPSPMTVYLFTPPPASTLLLCATSGGFRLDNRQRSSDNLRALFSIFSVAEPSSFFFSYNAQHQQADDFGIWGAHAEGVICGKIGKYVE